MGPPKAESAGPRESAPTTLAETVFRPTERANHCAIPHEARGGIEPPTFQVRSSCKLTARKNGPRENWWERVTGFEPGRLAASYQEVTVPSLPSKKRLREKAERRFWDEPEHVIGACSK
jgi:hypothetical protein